MSVHGISIRENDRGTTISDDDFGSGGHLDGLPACKSRDAAVWRANLRTVGGECVLDPGTRGSRPDAHVRARQRQGVIRHDDGTGTFDGRGPAADGERLVDQLALSRIEDDPQQLGTGGCSGSTPLRPAGVTPLSTTLHAMRLLGCKCLLGGLTGLDRAAAW